MNNLSLISFVGVDTKTNLDDIFNFQSHIPCEFSVLFSETKSVTKDMRYPDYDFCAQFLGTMASKVPVGSIHLCGTVIDKYLAEDSKIMDLCLHANRIQLNLNISNYSDYDKLSDNLLRMIMEHEHRLILQQNKTKAKFMSVLLDKLSETTDRISLLYDSSGGFGREITSVSTPNVDHFTGYAGGIKPTNVAKIVELVENVNPNNIPYYIDMESGVRTDNLFSMDLCNQVIEKLI